MAVILKITNQEGTTRYISPISLNLIREIGQPAELSCAFIDNLDTYETEDLSTYPLNPIQLNAEVVLERDSVQEFEGNITFKTVNKLGEGKWQITITALDKLYQGKNTRASIDNEDNWELSTDKTAISNMPLEASYFPTSSSYTDNPLVYFFPQMDTDDWDNSEKPWLDLENYNTSILRYPIGNGVYSVISGTPGSPYTLVLDATSIISEEEFIVNESLILSSTTLVGNKVAYKILSVGTITAGSPVDTLEIEIEAPLLGAIAGNYDVYPFQIELGLQGGILPTGIGLLDKEVIYYDGYDISPNAGETNYCLKKIRRGGNFIIGRSQSSHAASNLYPATATDTYEIEITGGATYQIEVSQNALFPPGGTFQVNTSPTWTTLNVVSSSWNGTTDTCTVIVEEDVSGISFTTAIVPNRFINIRPQGIAPGEFKFEGYNTTNSKWSKANENQYKIDFGNGWVVSPLPCTFLGGYWKEDNTAYYAASSWRVSYSYYDTETSPGTVLTIDDFIKTLVSEDEEYGGWGLSTSDVDTGSLETLQVNYISNNEPQLTFDVIDNFFTDLSLLGNEDLIGYYWDSVNSKFIVDALGSSTASKTYTQALAIKQDNILDEVYSGLLLDYELPAVTNYASSRMWVSSDTAYPVIEPNKFGILTLQQSGLNEGFVYLSFDVPADREEGITQHCYFPQTVLTDGFTNTGYALEYGAIPGTDAPSNTDGTDGEPLYFVWFKEPGYFNGDVCEKVLIDHIKVVIDIGKWSNPFVYDGDYQIDIQVVGYTNFTAPNIQDGTPITDEKPVYSGEIELPGLRYQLQNIADAVNVNGKSPITLEASGIGMELAAIAIKFNAAPTDLANPHPLFGSKSVQCKVREIIVEPPKKRSAFIHIIDNNGLENSDSTTLYAPLTYNKLVNDTHKIKKENIGIATDGAATTLGRSILLQKLVLINTKEYSFRVNGNDLPSLMETIQVYCSNSRDTYTGLVLSSEYSVIDGRETLNVLLKDFSSDLLI